MPTRSAESTWKGDLKGGSGVMKMESGAYEGSYSFDSRFQEGEGTNPEELIGAAHSGCFSMALANVLAEAGFSPEQVHTTAEVELDLSGDAPGISQITLNTEAQVPDLDDDEFQKHANDAKENCPVSKALASVPVKLNAKLVETS